MECWIAMALSIRLFSPRLQRRTIPLPARRCSRRLPIPGDEQPKTKYAVMIDGDPLPYLPDPLAVEISARILGHPTFTDEPVITIPFYPDTEWPEALPFKIELYENPDDRHTMTKIRARC